jgi:hypothetical protein
MTQKTFLYNVYCPTILHYLVEYLKPHDKGNTNLFTDWSSITRLPYTNNVWLKHSTWSGTYFIQDRQRKYNVTLGRVRATTVVVKKRKECYVFWERLCNLRYPACKAHATGFHLWPIRAYNNFPPHSTKKTIFEKNAIEHKMCYDFRYNICVKHFSF